VTGEKMSDMVITLHVQPVISEITVTAEAGHVASVNDVAQRVNVTSRVDIEQRFSNVLVDVLKEEVGVDVQRTSPVMGGISVRGLLGKNVAIYRDGVRYTTSAQRGESALFSTSTMPHT